MDAAAVIRFELAFVPEKEWDSNLYLRDSVGRTETGRQRGRSKGMCLSLLQHRLYINHVSNYLVKMLT